ncbi:MAG: ABC transporter substrate-binding protein [Candidatus Binatia bacterium]
MGIRATAAATVLTGVLAGCTNNPYPDADAQRKILYLSFADAPKTLDPAVAYSTVDHAVIGNVYDTLLEYHYLRRPFTLVPGLADGVPGPEPGTNGHVTYRFRLRAGAHFQPDPCFALGGDGRTTREITAADVAFTLARLADPAVNSPVVETFARVLGFTAFGEALAERRKTDPDFAARRIDEQYARAGGIAGVRVGSATEITLELTEPYPQILYWFAMPFTAPLPWEAVAFYDGREGRPPLAEHPVGSGPFVLARYDKRSRIVLERNPEWYGARHPEWHAPGATYPSEGEPGDAERGLLPPDAVGRPLPFLERIEFRRDPEAIPSFTKFLQGYYDSAGIIKESFDRIVREDQISPDMAARDVHLVKTVTPAVYYIGFNMDDPIVGARAGERGRKLRQAMSLAIDAREFARVFMNGRGIPAQSPLPPGIFGYDPDYANPYRTVDLDRARAILREAGYPGGIDPTTGKPLHLSFDAGDTGSRSLLMFQFYVNAWRPLGLDVEIAATSYNQFQEKIRKGAYQIFQWGWVADYPDPENFLFLLHGPTANSKSGGSNYANFADARYDALFDQMKRRENDPERLAAIREMRALLETERPWIELFHPEDYALFHGWLQHVKPVGLSIATAKYRDLDPALRARRRTEWNRPIRWPAYALAALAVALVAPALVTTIRRHR